MAKVCRHRRSAQWYSTRKKRYARILKRRGFHSQGILHRVQKISRKSSEITLDDIAQWTNDVVSARYEQAFGVLAEYRQVRDLRDRAYCTLTIQNDLELDPKIARTLLSAYDKLLKWFLTLSGHADLLGLGRMGRRGVEDIVRRMSRQLIDAIVEIGIVRECDFVKHEKDNVKRMLASAPAWFDLEELDNTIESATS